MTFLPVAGALRSRRSTASRSTATTTPTRTRQPGRHPGHGPVAGRLGDRPAGAASSGAPTATDPYVWRIRRIDAAGRTGRWSAWGEFRSSSPSATQTSPADGALVAPSDALFTWQAVPGAEATASSVGWSAPLTNVEPITTRATVLGAAARHRGWQLGWRVTRSTPPATASRPSTWRPFTVEDTVARPRRADQWLRPRSAHHSRSPSARVELRRRGHHDLPVAPERRRDRRRDRHHLHLTAADLAKNITVKATGTRPGYLSGTSTTTPSSASPAMPRSQ